MTFKSLHGGGSVVLDLSEDGIVLLEERRRLELNDEDSSGSEGFNHSVVISDGLFEGSYGLDVNFVSIV